MIGCVVFFQSSLDFCAVNGGDTKWQLGKNNFVKPFIGEKGAFFFKFCPVLIKWLGRAFLNTQYYKKVTTLTP